MEKGKLVGVPEELLKQLLESYAQSENASTSSNNSSGVTVKGRAFPSRLRLPSLAQQPSFGESDDDFEHAARPLPVLRPSKKPRTRAVPARIPVGKKRSCKKITRDIIVLPPDTKIDEHDRCDVPKGPSLQKLINQRLVGKIAISKSDTFNDVNAEIGSLFGTFEFDFLQIQPGHKKLSKPLLSRNCELNGETVLSFSPQGKIYLLAKEEVGIANQEPQLPLSSQSDSQQEQEFDDSQNPSTSPPPPPPSLSFHNETSSSGQTRAAAVQSRRNWRETLNLDSVIELSDSSRSSSPSRERLLEDLPQSIEPRSPSPPQDVLLNEEHLGESSPSLPDISFYGGDVCTKCFTTYKNVAGNCIRCEQDAALEETYFQTAISEAKRQSENAVEKEQEEEESEKKKRRERQRREACFLVRQVEEGKNIKFQFQNAQETQKFQEGAMYKDLFNYITAHPESTELFSVNGPGVSFTNMSIDKEQEIPNYIFETTLNITWLGDIYDDSKGLTTYLENCPKPYQHYMQSVGTPSEDYIEPGIDLKSDIDTGTRQRLSELLRRLKSKAQNSCASDNKLILCRRLFIVENVLNHFRFHLGIDAKGKTLERPYRVKFIGESGIDLAGLGREMATLFLSGLGKSKYMNGLTLGKSQDLVEDGSYKVLGNVMANCAVNFGICPGVFGRPVIAHLLGIQYQSKDPEDVPCLEYRQHIIKLCASKTDQEVMELASTLQLDDWGVRTSKTSIGVDDLPTILRQSIKHLAVLNVHSELEELSKGLNAFGLLDDLKKDPLVGKAFFSRSEKLQSQWFFDDVNVNFEHSEKGNNRRIQEEQAHMAFAQFTQRLENGLVMNENGKSMSLKDLLQFWVAMDAIPPQGLGFVLKCSFVEGVLPSSNTCAGLLRIPLLSSVTDLEAAFKEAIIGSPCFDDEDEINTETV